MAIHIRDTLSELLESDVQNSRNERFLWLVCAQRDTSLLEISPLGQELRHRVAMCLQSNPKLLSSVKFALKYRQIPLNYFSWLTNDARQCSWIALHAATSFSRNAFDNSSPQANSITPNTVLHLRGRDGSIALIDYIVGNLSFSLGDAIELLNQLSLSWLDQLQQDRIFEWIKQNDEAACLEYFWRQLQSRHAELVFSKTPFATHDNMLIFFDHAPLSVEQRELLSLRARSAWNQKMARERNTDKKQCNFLLSNRTLKSLEKLSLKHKLSRTEIIELLIDSEFKTEIHIENRLHRKLLLTDPQE